MSARGRRPRRSALLVTFALAAAGASSPAHASQFLTGFVAAPPPIAPALDTARMRTAGADVVRINLTWSQVAPSVRPQRFDPTDPFDPAYDWGRADAAVRAAASQRLRILLNVVNAPSWAEGRGRPASAAPGVWRPNASDFGAFVRAAARRYSGTYAGLPRVRLWQLWDEPNLSLYLAPQWTGRPHAWRAASPGIYRDLLNAGYDALKSVGAGEVVVAAGTAPYGDYPGGPRMSPVPFARGLFCLDARLRPLQCKDPPHLDVLDHHPYSVAGPFTPAASRDDATIPDIGRLARVYRAAERTRRVVPTGAKPIWATEFSWDSAPPDRAGVPLARWRRWIQLAFFELWRQGVTAALWLEVSDSAPPFYTPDNVYECGVFTADGATKPGALEAFRFPFVAVAAERGGMLLVWMRPPHSGSVAIERRVSGRWRVVARVSGRRGDAATALVPAAGSTELRAVDAWHEASLVWRG